MQIFYNVIHSSLRWRLQTILQQRKQTFSNSLGCSFNCFWYFVKNLCGKWLICILQTEIYFILSINGIIMCYKMVIFLSMYRLLSRLGFKHDPSFLWKTNFKSKPDALSIGWNIKHCLLWCRLAKLTELFSFASFSNANYIAQNRVVIFCLTL